MHARTTVLLALAVVIASIIAWLDVRSSPTGSVMGDAFNPAPADTITPLLHFNPGAVAHVSVQRGSFSVQLTRTAQGWDGIGNASSVDDFLHSLAELAEIIVVGQEAGGPHDFGLDPPVATVRLEGDAMTPIELHLGNPNPTSTGVYAQVGRDGPVVVTGALAQWEMDKLIHAAQGTSAPASPVALRGPAAALCGSSARAIAPKQV